MIVKDENYITIQGWMITRLGLKGNELLIYAIIFGFSQNFESSFTGSLKYLSEFTNCTTRTVINCLKNMTEKGIIQKRETIENGVKSCEYFIPEGSENFSQGVVKNFQGGSEKISLEVVKNFQGGSEKISHNNTNYTSIDNTKDNKSIESTTSVYTIVDLYNEICVSFPKLRSVSGARIKALKARLRVYSVSDFEQLFRKAESSSFLKGANNRNWSATFDWLIKDSNMAKVLDGNYDDKGGKKFGRSGVEILPENEQLHDLDDIF